MRTFLFALLTTSTQFYSYAQSDTIRRSCLQFMSGAINSRMVDQGLTFDRQLFAGTAFKFYSAYERVRTKNVLLASFEINGGKLKLEGEQVRANLTNGQLAASYLFKSASYKIIGNQSRLYIGPKIGTLVNYVNSQQQLDNETLVAIYGLYIHAFQQIQLSGRSFLDVSIALPTVAFSKRLVLDGGLHEPNDDDLLSILSDDATFSLGKMLEFNAAWSGQVGRKTYLSVRYRFAYLANTEFGDFRFYSNELLAGFRFYFKHE